MSVTKTFDFGISKSRVNKFTVSKDTTKIINLFDEKISRNPLNNRNFGVVGFTIVTDKDILFCRENENISNNVGEGVINSGSKILALDGKPQIFPYDSNAIKFQAVSETANVEILEIFHDEVGV